MNQVPNPQPLSDHAAAAAHEALAGRRGGLRSTLLFVGPAVIASIAYMDPGNFATNIEAGSRFGYTLLWVVLAANLVAMLFQMLSARLGIVTGHNLAELSRRHFPRPWVLAMWALSEVAAMATELAELLGGGLALSLMTGMPVLAGMAITALLAYAILLLERRGYRSIELAISAFVALIGLCYLAELLLAPVDWPAAGMHLLRPSLHGEGAPLVAVGMVGATVMPHAIYLHSGLTQRRIEARDMVERRRLVRFSNREVVVALSLAGLVNMAMVIMASSAFHAGHREVTDIASAYRTLTPLLGGAAASIFLVSLLGSGISSSVVGTMAGQTIMQGFLGFRTPIWLRRLVTMLPAFAVVACGFDATQVLVLSQVVLSLALPVPMLALLAFTRRRDIMGEFANGRLLGAVAGLAAALILALNLFLLLQAAGIP